MNMLRRKGFMPHLLWGTGLGIVIVACIIVVLTINSKTSQYKSQIEERDAIIAQLTQQWEELGPSVQGLVAIKDVSGGQEIRPDNWQEYFAVVDYPEKLNLKVAQPSMFTSNKYIRASLGTGTVLIADNILMNVLMITKILRWVWMNTQLVYFRQIQRHASASRSIRAL